MGSTCCKRLMGIVGNDTAREVQLLQQRETGVELREGPPGNREGREGPPGFTVPPCKPSTSHKPSTSCIHPSMVKAFPMAFAEPPPGEQFATSYEKAPSGNYAFLIPGDEELFVGGGALNGAVGKLLMKEAGQRIAYEMTESGEHVMEMDPGFGREVPKFNKIDCVYRRLHEIMFEKARLRVRSLAVATTEDIGNAPVSFAAARVTSDAEWPFGAVFVDVFNADKRPFDSPKNVALLYTVGALGRNKRAEGEGRPESFREVRVKANAQDFVYELYLTGQNVIDAILEYNTAYAGKGNGQHPPRIDRIRLPIISGGTFIHPQVTPTEVALALLWGVHEALSKTTLSARPEIELMPEKSMQDAYRLYFEEAARPEQWNIEEKKFLFSKIGQ